MYAADKMTQLFTFIDVSDPAQRSDKVGRKATQSRVRATAALNGWNKRRSRAISIVEPFQQYSPSTEYVNVSRSRSASHLEPEPSSSATDAEQIHKTNPSSASPGCAVHLQWQSLESFNIPSELRRTDGSSKTNQTKATDVEKNIVSKRPSDAELDTSRRSKRLRRMRRSHNDLQDRRSPKRALQTTLPFSFNLRTASGNPFQTYPVEAQPWFEWVIHDLFTNFMPLGWAPLGIPTSEGEIYQSFASSLIFSSPACFYTCLYHASGIHVLTGRLTLLTNLWLRDRAISAINTAIADADPRVRLSDAMIYTIGLLAGYEVWFGDPKLGIEVHRPAYRRMLQLRGGFDSWNVPTALKKISIWMDCTISVVTGVPMSNDFDVEEVGKQAVVVESKKAKEKGALTVFGCKETLGALRAWFPHCSERFTEERYEHSVSNQERPD